MSGMYSPECVPVLLSELALLYCVQVDAVKAAYDADDYVKHPLLDRVRECSADPDAAADFFLQMLHPYPTCRMSTEAQTHVYLAETFDEMEAYCQGSPLMTLPYALDQFVEAQQSGKPVFKMPQHLLIPNIVDMFGQQHMSACMGQMTTEIAIALHCDWMMDLSDMIGQWD